jgi:hypothetical protein
VAQAVERLLCKCEALSSKPSSIPSPQKKSLRVTPSSDPILEDIQAITLSPTPVQGQALDSSHPQGLGSRTLGNQNPQMFQALLL